MVKIGAKANQDLKRATAGGAVPVHSLVRSRRYEAVKGGVPEGQPLPACCVRRSQSE